MILLVSPQIDAPEIVTVGAIASLAICLWCWCRLFATGVRVDENRVTASSWWSRKQYPRQDIARFRAEPYYGFFFVLGWTVYGGQFQSGEVVVELRDGRVIRLRGTVCNRATARRLAEALNRWLQVEQGSGIGPRRLARYDQNAEGDLPLA